MVNKFKETPGVTKNFQCYVASWTLWFENHSNMKTVISFLDYWKIKNNTKVDIEVRTFTKDGALKKKENLYFKNGLVKNVIPLDGKKGA